MEDLDAASASALAAIADPDDASVEAAMQAPVTVGLGPVGPLLRKLHRQSRAPDLLSAKQVRLLKILCIWLKGMSEEEEASCLVQWWMKMARELCYDTDDHLDKLIATGSRAADSRLLARVNAACERHLRFKLSPTKNIKPGDRGETSLELPPVPLPVHNLEPPKNLVEMLALDDAENTLKVIPIHGCAGVGKTTAARALYHKHAGKFQCRAFVTVSRNPDMRGFLTSMLKQLKAQRPGRFPDVPDLIDAINKYLQGKRYFIVIDDMWTASVWNVIWLAFPRDDSCSRIITTTEIEDVALACSGYYSERIYKMEPLDDNKSRELFFSRVFSPEDDCPKHIKEVSDVIVKCGGLPLAIVNIASLLANESKNVAEKWKHVHDSLSSTSVGMENVLNLMYNSLPSRLRTFLLYLSMYAQGYVIKKDELVKHWVAEGFLRAVEGQGIEEIAEGYFDELVTCKQRNGPSPGHRL
ncbi:unnamed protein product [Triticum turgidum subsp. durum]|uniref:NB-ARC domain-containing protein n=1 Tax=Triticum turgidum subsp. durum TaxID=4567 RepID=A0A9R1RVE3_TRITD|nr:unnamed protein product [Triticum turgidum subsp. durum]